MKMSDRLLKKLMDIRENVKEDEYIDIKNISTSQLDMMIYAMKFYKLQNKVYDPYKETLQESYERKQAFIREIELNFN